LKVWNDEMWYRFSRPLLLYFLMNESTRNLNYLITVQSITFVFLIRPKYRAAASGAADPVKNPFKQCWKFADSDKFQAMLFEASLFVLQSVFSWKTGRNVGCRLGLW
jgi:hypothetical protein